jgi:hypothetical protein
LFATYADAADAASPPSTKAIAGFFFGRFNCHDHTREILTSARKHNPKQQTPMQHRYVVDDDDSEDDGGGKGGWPDCEFPKLTAAPAPAPVQTMADLTARVCELEQVVSVVLQLLARQMATAAPL